METVTLQTIHKDLELLKNDISKIKKHMIDIDTIMTEDDYKALQDYKREKSEGKLTVHEELKKEIGL